MLNLTLDQAQEIVKSGERLPITLDEAWQWLGYSNKAIAQRDLELICEDCVEWDYSYNGDILLSIECFKELAVLANTTRSAIARGYFAYCSPLAWQMLPE
jgi:hypothetical protein